MYEVELKARIDDAQAMHNKLLSLATFLGTSFKHDAYWLKKNDETFRLRIRNETKTDNKNNQTKICTVTIKEKTLNRDTVTAIAYEVNNEREFIIQDEQKIFEFFLKKADFKYNYSKTKQVTAFKKNNILAELCYIENLGNFLELEILNESGEKNTVEQDFLHLKQFFIKCNIPLDNIEHRYYSELITLKKQGVPNV